MSEFRGDPLQPGRGPFRGRFGAFPRQHVQDHVPGVGGGAGEVREVVRSHLNYIVADTGSAEQIAASRIDQHRSARAFVKNAGLGFGVPYFHNGQDHEFVPDFLIRLDRDPEEYLILETKGYDPLDEVKKAAALRWCAAVNAEGSFGHWQFKMARQVGEVDQLIADAYATLMRQAKR